MDPRVKDSVWRTEEMVKKIAEDLAKMIKEFNLQKKHMRDVKRILTKKK